MVVSSGSAPVYVSPAMSWTAGSAEGPVFNFVFNDTTFAGLAIPSASTSASGIITTGSQSLAGNKTLTGVTYASNVEPRTSGSYSLGKYSSETDHAIWANLIVRNINIYDGNNKNIAKTSYENGTTSTQGYSNLVLGNNTASGTAGNSTGRLRLYGANTGYSNLTYVNSTTNASHVLPAASGTLMVSATSAYNSNSEVTLNIPFYSSTNAPSMQLGYNDGFTLLHQNGTSTVNGKSYLILGNNLVGVANNKEGRIRLYGNDNFYTEIRTNDANLANYTIALPAANGELVYHVENAAQGGPTSSSSGDYKLIKVTVNGEIVADTASNVAAGTNSGKQLMYLNNGALTASSVSVAAGDNAGKQLMYLNGGVLTASSASIAAGTNAGKQLMYLSGGVLTASTADVAANNKLMYLVDGILTASEANIGNSKKFVYVEGGTLKVSAESVASDGKTLMYMNAGELTTSGVTLGSATQPVYLKAGVLTTCTAYSGLLTAFSGSSSATDNTASITVGGTTETATIIGGVSTVITGGTTSGPSIKTIVNGIESTAVNIPLASYSASGVVAKGNQIFGGVKTFGDGLKISASGSDTDCATFTYDASTDTLTVSFP